MQSSEVLAIARLRQWSVLRLATLHGKQTNYQRKGWNRRNETKFAANQILVIDFERALGKLEAEEQIALVHRYRDRESDVEIAQAIGCSARKVSYLMPAARRKLTAILDRLDML
jgi:DNA-directed RNA polymerase specialized sigma24 family protein